MKPKVHNRFLLSALTLAGFTVAMPSAFATNYYWDTDGATAGAGGGSTPSGTWSGGGTTWSTSSAGTVAGAAVTTGAADDLFLSAGTTATGAYTITLTTGQNAKSLTFEEGSVTISGTGGIITFGAGGGGINVIGAASATIGNNTTAKLAGSVGLTKLGVGTLTLNGTATNTFTGALNVNAGSVVLDFSNIAASTNLLTASNTLAFSGGNLSIKGKATSTTTQTLGAVTVNAGGGTLLVNPNGGTSTTLALGTLASTAAGGSLTLGKALGAGTGTLSISTTSNKDATGIYSGRIVFANGTADTGYDWATTASASTPFVLSSYSAYSPLATSGSDTGNSRITASSSLSGSLTTNSLKIENPPASQVLDLGANLLTLTSGGLLVTGTSATQIIGSGAPGLVGGSNGGSVYDLIISQYNSGGLEIAASIGNNGVNATSLTKTGSGALTLSGTNSLTGGLFINSGNVTLGSTGALNNTAGSENGVTFSSASTSTLTLGGNSVVLRNLSTNATTPGTPIVQNASATPATLTIGNSTNVGGTFAGVIRDGTGGGSLALVKAGTGTVTHSGANTYSGVTNVNAGTLTIASATALGTTSANTVVAAGSEVFCSTPGLAVAEPFNIAGNGTAAANGAIHFGGGSTVVGLNFSGAVTLSADATIKNDGSTGSTFSGGINIGSNTLTFATGGGATNTVNTNGISGAGGSVVKDTLTGTLNLNAANSFSGTTTLNGGTLQLGNVNALQNTSGIIMANGTTLQPTTIGVTLTAPITTSGSVKIGAPTAASGTQTFNEFVLNGAIGGTGNVTFNNSNNTNQIFTVTLGAACSYSGTTTIDNSAGTAGQTFVKLGVTDALPTTTILNILGQTGTGTGRGIELNLFGFSQTLAGLTNTAASLRTQRVVNSDASAAATLTINGPTNTTFSGNLGGSANFSVNAANIPGTTNGNNFGLTKNGSGTFTISGVNSYYGTTRILGGILSLGNASAMLQSPLDTTSSVSGDTTNGLQTSVTTLTLGGLTGNKDLASLFTTSSGGYSGVTALTLNPVNGVTTSYLGSIADGAPGMTLNKSGAGTQSLSGASTFTGTTTLSAGTLKLDFSAAGAASSNILSPSSALIMSGGTLTLQGKASTSNSQQLNGLTVAAGISASIQLHADPSGNPLVLDLGAITRNAGSRVDFTLPTGAQNASNGITTSTANTSGNLLGSWATVGGTSWASNNGTNIVPLSSYTLSSVAGTTSSNYFNADVDVDNNAGLLDAVITANSLRFSTSAATTLTLAAGTNVISSGGILVSSSVGNNLSTITGGTLVGSASGDLTIIQNNTSNSLLIASDIADNVGATGLVKMGPGSLVLSGLNTYTGFTTVSGGMLQLAKYTSLYSGNTGSWTASNIQVAGGCTLGFNVGGTDEFLSGDIASILSGLGGANGSSSGGFAAGSAIAFDTTNAGGSFTISNAITNSTGSGGGAIGLVKLGTGTLSLTGLSTRTGPTTINNGTLQISGSGVLGGASGTYAGAISIASGATLQASGTSAQTLSGAISGAGGLIKDTSTSDLNLSGVNSYTGTTTVSSGRIAAGNASNLSNGATNLVQSGIGQFFVSTAVTCSNPFNISTTGYTEGGDSQSNTDGAIRLSGGTLTGTITLSGNSRIGAFNTTTNTISGQITGAFGIDFYGFQNTANAAPVFVISNTSNNYTGNTTIYNSNYNTTNLVGVSTTLKLGASNVIPDGASAGNLIFATNGTNNNSTDILDLNGFSETINGLEVNAGTFATRITNTATGSSILTLGANNTTSSFPGTITDAGSGKTLAITKIGTGILTLSGANSYSGNTTVNGGKLAISTACLADAADVSIAVGASMGLDYAGTDTIDELSIDGIAKSAGTYGATGSGATNIDDVHFTGTGTLTVTTSPSASGYASWAAAKGLDDSNAAHASAKSADPDGDGNNNLYEFAFDGNPLSGVSDGKIVSKIATVGGNQVLTLTLPVRTGATFSSSSGDQLSALIQGIYYRVEGDVNLATFASTISEVTSGDASSIQSGLPTLSTGWTYRTFRAPGTTSTVSSAFLRAKVSETP